MSSDPIREAAVSAVSSALSQACESNGILPPVDISARLWAEGILGDALKRGNLPTESALREMLKDVPPLLISDRNK